MSIKCSIFPTLVKAQEALTVQVAVLRESREPSSYKGTMPVLGGFGGRQKPATSLSSSLSLPGPDGVEKGWDGQRVESGLTAPCPSASEIPLWHICSIASGQAEGGQ